MAGGICYFLWERDNKGLCEIVNRHNDTEVISKRQLNEFDIFIRHSQAVPIIRKVLAKDEKQMNEQVSAYKPFGLRTYHYNDVSYYYDMLNITTTFCENH